MMMSGYNIKDLIQEAQFRWLRPGEVLFILQNYEETQLNHEPSQKPPSGSLFLFNKRVLRFFRKDGHSWRKKKDGKNVGEAHERLKVGNVEALNCYYAHGEENPNFQRRSYWMLDTAMEHIVLVHYRDITIGKHSAGPISSLTLGSSNIIQSSHSYTTQLISPSASEFDEPYTSLSAGFTSVEASQSVLTTSHRLNLIERIEETDPSPDLQINQALRRLEEQLSLDGLKDVGIYYSDNDVGLTFNEQSYSGSEGLHYGSDDYVSLQHPVLDKAEDQLNTLGNCTTDHAILHQYQQSPMGEFTIPSQQTLIWKDILKYNGNATDDGSLENYVYPSDQNEVLLPQSQSDIMEDQVKHHSGDTGASNDSSILLSQELEDSTFPAYISPKNMFQSDADLYSTLFDQGQIGTPLTSDSSLTIAQEQKFSIREISPEWGYVTEPTKVLIIGTFTCDPSNNEWICMFGDTEVPVKIIQEGVISCHAPPHPPGKVTMCITSGNREACSEVREFEYLDKPNMQVRTNFSENELKRSPEELLLLVRFVQMLLSDKTGQNDKSTGMESDVLTSSMAGEDSWTQIIESVLNGNLESWKTIDWLLEEVLKDKLQRWIWLKLQEKESLPVLSKREQGIIHMVSGLGFVWALAPILKSGVGINFRDINGWTALHWASRFGREKMIAELLASGAYAGAVTDPSQQDPSGKTAASIAATYGHNGLAGYLAEVALTTHLSSLTLKESELSKCSADVEAERTVNSISNPNFVNTDRLSFKETMAAVRNAAQAASRIQAAFRVHSFKKRKQQEAAASGYDEYGICERDIEGTSAASKVIFGNARDHNAALSIQKKYRGWKGRKDYLAFRKKVVKIQAHVRGHQARKNYEIICWAVGIVEKIVLRWHRKGVGLRGFHLDSVDETENEDIMKIFRKQKVDVALSEAVSRVVSMMKSSPARQQYHRMLQKYQQAKAERGGLEMEMESEGGSISQDS